MKKELMIAPSEFKALKNIEYFDFEEDFIEEGLRCIPMVVRCKLDKTGIKLKISEWVKFNSNEKIELALMNCENEEEINRYHKYLARLVQMYTGKEATLLSMDPNPAWANKEHIPEELQRKVGELKEEITIDQWQSLTGLQRFALLKLCKPGHENKNFPKALKEFNLV
jgi:hypothetical protein